MACDLDGGDTRPVRHEVAGHADTGGVCGLRHGCEASRRATERPERSPNTRPGGSGSVPRMRRQRLRGEPAEVLDGPLAFLIGLRAGDGETSRSVAPKLHVGP